MIGCFAFPEPRSNYPIVMETPQAILEAVREAGEPLSSADCTSRIAAKHGVAADDPALARFVTHVSAALNSLVKRKRVRQVGTVDRRNNWGMSHWLGIVGGLPDRVNFRAAQVVDFPRSEIIPLTRPRGQRVARA